MHEKNSPPGTCEICIVGAGPAGIVLAHALGSAGREVLLIESGGDRASRRVLDLNDGECSGVAYDGLGRTRHRQLGGTSKIWNVSVEGRIGAKYVPLGARDVTAWPVGWEALRPYYAKAQVLCGLGPFEYGADHWASDERRPFALDDTPLTSGVYQFGTAERFDALLERARRLDSVTLAPWTTATGLILSRGGGRVIGVRAADANGTPFEIAAETVVLACGAVENARLLLLAGFERSAGLAWLGRGFMEHARDFSLTLVPASPRRFAEAGFYDLHRARDGTLIGGRLCVEDEAAERFDLPSAALTLIPRIRPGARRSLLERVVGRLRRVRRGRGQRYGWSAVPRPEQTFDVFRLVLNFEQRPLERNRVELCDRRDRFGNRLPRLHLEWTQAEQARLERYRHLLAEWCAAGGLGRLMIVPGAHPDMNAHHHAGTTRMAEDAADGVVDRDGRVFGVENLYVAGASVFPTAGFANPTLTIVALALRLAQRLARSTADGKERAALDDAANVASTAESAEAATAYGKPA